MTNNSNHLIYKNTVIIYIRMIFVSFVGLFSSRFVLQALGASDYGLYNVVGGLITLFGFLGTAMSTTSRRYINVEMGRPNGDLNKVFNICLIIHVGFALLLLFVAESIGIWYVNNVLNVADGKLGDAMFVFQVSTLVACLGLINIPYQSLIEANERFGLAAVIDILTTIVKFGLIIVLLYYPGNSLRFYSVLICGVTILSFVLYHIVCVRNWPSVIKHKFYHKSRLYREVLVFNNYTAMGALASIGRSQGANMIVNFFFGTIVNASFAIAFQVETYVYMFVNKITLASNPQVAINYSGNNMQRVKALVEKNSRLSILIMTVFFFPLICEMDFILELWLKHVPDGASLLCTLTLVSALVTSFSEGTYGFIQASGKIKWFQIVGSILLLANLPIGCVLFKMGMDSYWIIVCFIILAIVSRIASLYMMKKILDFDIRSYIHNAYIPPLITIVIMSVVTIVYRNIHLGNAYLHLLGMVSIMVLTFFLVLYIGLTYGERKSIFSYVKNRFRIYKHC